jgi:hypothetical protein
MAQTKSATKKSKAKSGTSGSGSKAKPGSRSKASKPRSKAGAPSSRASSRNGSSKGGSGAIESAREAVGDAGQKAGKAATEAASKAKVPLIAGGAALVGAAGGFALNAARSNGSKVLGVKMPKARVKVSSKDLVKAADRVASAGEQIGRVSTGIRELQGTSDADHGNGLHRSPIEVLIQGLTRRH